MASRIEPVRAPANKRRAQLAVAAVGALPALVVFLVDVLFGHPIIGLLMALVVGAVIAMWAWNAATLRAIAGVGARTATPQEHPRLHNLVDGLCAIAGVAKPEIHVRDDERPDSCSLGLDAERAHLVVTSGLLNQLSRVELEAVVAHELAHIRQLDIAPATVVAGLGQTPVGGLVRAVAGRGPVEGDFGSEPQADLDGVRLTRYPPGLVSALEKVAAAPAASDAERGSSNYPWLSSEEHPNELRFRIDVLREL